MAVSWTTCAASPGRGGGGRERTHRGVSVLGATGTVGQRLVALLDGHPRFEVVSLVASSRSAGRAYGEVVQWRLSVSRPRRWRGSR